MAKRILITGSSGLIGSEVALFFSREGFAMLGDPIRYDSDLRKMKAHDPGWGITKSLVQTIGEIVEAWHRRLAQGSQTARSP